MSRRLFIAALLTPAAISAAAGAQHTSARTAPRVRTLVTTSSPIVSFAQDGTNIAWVTAARKGAPCTRRLHIRSLRSGHADAVRIGCGHYSELALAGRRVLWKNAVGGGNLERDLDVMTIAAGQRRPRRLERIHLDFEPSDCFRLDLTCSPEREPVVAGGEGVLAYSAPSGVRRVVRGKRRPLFAFRTPAALATSGGRLLALRSELRPGDGCGCASEPAWMPGAKIAYLSHVGRSADLTGELSVVDADGSHRTVLTHDGVFRVALDVSPDGTKIAYAYVRPADASRVIAVAAADGSGAHDVGDGDQPAWSPDGTRVAFVRGAQGSRQVYVMDADGGNVRQLTQGPESTQPAWSPDGTRIAYVADGISIVNADGSDAHALGVRGSAPDWSPDGGAIAFQRAAPWYDVMYRDELYLVAPDGSGTRPLTFSIPAGWASPAGAYAADGRRVAAFEVNGTAYDVALGAGIAAVASTEGAGATVTLFNARSGKRRGAVVIRKGQPPNLAGIAGRRLVFVAGKTISALDVRSLERSTLAVAAGYPIGLSVSGSRVAWAENVASHGRIRALTLPR